MAESIDDLLHAIDAGAARTCYLIHGDDTFPCEDALARILAALFPDGADELNCFKLDGEGVSVEEILESILTPSLVPGRKAVVVRNTDLLASGKAQPSLPENFAQLLADNLDGAARSFLSIVGARGWALDDLVQDGWQRIPDEEWRRFFEGSGVTEFGEILPGLIEHCVDRGMKEQSARGSGDRIEAALVDGLPPDMVLILTARAVDRRKKLYKTIADTGAILHFAQEKTDALRKTSVTGKTREYLAKRGLKISPEALDLLIDRAGLNFSDIAAELEKLATYLGPGATVIGGDDVARVVGQNREERIFELTNALARKDLERGLLVMKRLMDQDVHPLALLSMIAREVRFLIQAKLLVRSGRVPSSSPPPTYRQFQDRLYPNLADGSAKGKKSKNNLVGQHPYVIYNTLNQAERFSWDELVRLMDSLVETDIALKSSGGDPKLLMERLLFGAARGGIHSRRN